MSTLKRFDPSDEDRMAALKEIYYEIEQLLLSLRLKGAFQAAENAILESVLVHVRVLLDFFERDKRSTRHTAEGKEENDDVLSRDYGFEASQLAIDRRIRERLNKDLAHLSYSRVRRREQGGKRWKYGDFLPVLVQRCIEFIRHVEAHHDETTGSVGPDAWHQLRTEAEALLDALPAQNSSPDADV